MRKIRKLLVLMVGALGLLACGWVVLTTNLMGVKLDPSIALPSDGNVVVYDSTLRAYKASASGGGSGGGINGKSAGVSLSGTATAIDVDQGLTATLTSGTYRITPTYGTPVSVGATTGAGAANTFARSDHTHAVTDLAIASQAADDLLRFNGTNWVRFAEGAVSTVLQVSSGGVVQYATVTNAMLAGAITVDKLNSGAATNGQVATADGAGNVTWTTIAAGSGSGILVTNNTSPSTTMTQTALDFVGTGVTANTSASTLSARISIPQNYAVNRNVGGPRLLVPAYSFPGAPYWPDMLAGAPSVGIAIINPASGPYADAGTIALYQTQSVSATAVGISVVGYVALTFGAKSAANVQAEIDTYYYLFPNIDGVFFDECPTSVALQPYVQTLFNYVKTKRAGQKIVILNPGVEPLTEQYTRCGDIICTFENTHTVYQSYSPVSWTKNYPASKFFHIIHGDTVDGTNIASEMEADMALAQQRNAGWVFITNQFEATNPYELLPTPSEYWLAEIRMSARGSTRWQTNGSNTGLAQSVNVTGTGVTATFNPTNSQIDYTITSAGGSSPVAGTNIAVSGSTVSVSPTAGAAGGFLVSNGSFFINLAAGTTSQVLVGGTSPGFGNVPLAAVTEVLALANLTDVTATSGSGTTVVLRTNPALDNPTFNTSATVNAGGQLKTDNVSSTTVNGILRIGPNGPTGRVSYYGADTEAKGLIIKYVSTTSFDIDATVVPVTNTINETIYIWNVNQTITTSGAAGINSIDTGSRAADTWYYIWIVYNAVTNTQGTIFSLSSTAPTMPSGFSYKYLAGPLRTLAGSTSLLPWSQYKDVFWWQYVGSTAVASDGGQIANALTSTTFATLDGSKRIPPISRTGFFRVMVSCDATGGSASLRETGVTSQDFFVAISEANGVEGSDIVFPVDAAGDIDYKVTTGDSMFVDVLGFQITR